LLSFNAPLDDVLYLENPRAGDLLIAGQETVGEVYLDDKASNEIAGYEDGFETLAKIALDHAASQKFIEMVLGELY
jgi:hypothetical protein